MNFKRLELYGFKSFADKTVVDFNDGITGIVGPNGSGKSNFSDAIKWVLGEQSAKSLRGKSMQDVIFVGSQRRSQMSYCEVSLVFDNTDHKVFKGLDFDEVVISRKLYRSGESEYLINNVVCKLSNIKDIIRDTGLGKDGYSIIGQGRVTEIINSKPENRRTIFEEAAGISKYKKRKQESEAKLEQTRDHLERLQDIIKEIQRRLGPLEKQASDAKEYNRLFSEQRTLEVNHYLYANDNKDKDIEKVQNIINGVIEEINQIQRDIEKNESDYSDANYHLRRCDEELMSLNSKLTELLVNNQKKLGFGQTMTERLSSLKKEKERLSENIEKYESNISECELSILEINNNLNALHEKLASVNKKYEKNQALFDEVVADILDKEKLFEESEKAMMDALDKLSDVKVDINVMNSQLEILKEKKIELEDSIKTLKYNIEKEEDIRRNLEIEVNSLTDSFKKDYNILKSDKEKLSKIRFENSVLNKSLNELQGSISAFEAKRKIMVDAKNQYESFQMAVKRLMQYTQKDQILNSKIVGVLAELIRVPKEYEVAIEVALGGALQNIVTPTIDDVKYCIDFLKSNRLGTITFLPCNTMKPRFLRQEQLAVLDEVGCVGVANELIEYDKKYNNVVSNLLGSTIICDTYENAVRINRKYRSAFRIVTLEGESFSTQGSVTGGSRKNDTLGILSQEREINQVEERLAGKKAELVRATERLKQIAIEEKELSESVEKLSEKLKDKDILLNTKTNELNLVNDKIDDYTTSLTNANNSYTILCDRLDEIAIRLSGSDKLQSDIVTSRMSIDDEKSKSKQLLSAKTQEKDNLQSKLNDIRLEIIAIESDIEKANADKENKLAEINTSKANYLEDKSYLNTVLANIKTTENDINNAELSIEDKKKKEQIDKSIKDYMDRKEELSDKIAELLKDKDINIEKLRVANERKLKEEANIEKINLQFSNMTERIKETYGLELYECEPFRIPDFNDEGVVTQIANYKRAITNLGSINFSAVEEFEEENKRFTELSTERDDLLKAEEDLLSVVADLSKEMQEIFDYEFGKISKNFEVTFKEIFGGGSGKLVVDTNAEDPLSAGIDIIVALPGKKQSNISLLSGGEMALTAIAILFAILKSKPMPFCVLDEIEAALDDTNVSLFARYLKKFVGNTQFIVITHRKPTMEQADRLYGVTMEEKGVSKVVSVELSEALKIKEN